MTRLPTRGRTFSRVTPELMAFLAEHLTERDRRIARHCHLHRVLTTHHLTDLEFGSASHARARLDQLTRWRVLDRARPFTPIGSAPWHYVLGPAGARVIAAEDGTTVADLGWRRDHTIDTVFSSQIGHILGVNTFFTTLAAYARHHPGAQLLAWWPQRRCAAEYGTYARPDAYAHWRDAGDEIRFFLEYDTGTEPARDVAAKLTDYTELAAATVQNIPVLIYCHGPRREAHLRSHLTAHPGSRSGLAVATGHADTTVPDAPAGSIWQPLTPADRRLRLAELPRHLPADPPC